MISGKIEKRQIHVIHETGNEIVGNKKELFNNALVTILRCPVANEYYKAVTGIDFSQVVRNRDE